jgi:hypothetical protein
MFAYDYYHRSSVRAGLIYKVILKSARIRADDRISSKMQSLLAGNHLPYFERFLKIAHALSQSNHTAFFGRNHGNSVNVIYRVSDVRRHFESDEI